MSLALATYHALTTALQPFAPALLRARARRGKEDPARLGERLGHASHARPAGTLVWLHGASVGESLSILPLVEGLRTARPDLALLVTSGTRTSAELLANRLPIGVIHQFAPVDTPNAAARFLDQWRPSLAVFAESEIWPNILRGARKRGAKTALVSARLSRASVAGWARAPHAARTLFGGFDLVLAQDDATAAALVELGGKDDGRLNLKLFGEPLPVDGAALSMARSGFGARPVLLAASTHPGEDEIVLEVFAWLKDRPDRPLLVLVPRHPARGETIASLARREGFTVARRGADEPLTEPIEVYVADTLGELGLWLRLACAAFIGGSLVEGVGGHNPLEAARLDCPAISGRHVENWRPVYAALEAQRAVRMVGGASMLAGAFAEALTDSAALAQEARRAKAFAYAQTGAIRQACDHLLALLPDSAERPK